MKSLIFASVIYIDYDLKDDPYFDYLLGSFSSTQAIRILGNKVEKEYESYRIIPYEDKVQALKQDMEASHLSEKKCILITCEPCRMQGCIVIGTKELGSKKQYPELKVFCHQWETFAKRYFGINITLFLAGCFCFMLGVIYGDIVIGCLAFVITTIWTFVRVPNKMAFLGHFLDGLVIG